MESARAAYPKVATPISAIRLTKDSQPNVLPSGLFSWNLLRVLAQRQNLRYNIPSLVSFALFIERASLF